MLNKNRITGKVAMDDWRGTGMQITKMWKRKFCFFIELMRNMKIELDMTHLSADKICVHHRLQACNGNFLTFRFVRFRNIFNEPDDIYSVIKITYNL